MRIVSDFHDYYDVAQSTGQEQDLLYLAFFQGSFRKDVIEAYRKSPGRRRWRRPQALRIVYHACLREVEFFRVFDPYTAYQKIAMCLGGLARPQKAVPEVPDKTLSEAKGFDEWSFRKPRSFAPSL